eukprot:1592997-Rhodomonas_salina.1
MRGPCLSGSRLDQVLQHRAEAVVVLGRLEQFVLPGSQSLEQGLGVASPPQLLVLVPVHDDQCRSPPRLICVSQSLHPEASILAISLSVRQARAQRGFCVPILQHAELNAP